MDLPFWVRLVICLSVFVCTTALFSVAAGTLNPTKINLINLTYYSYMVLTYAGSALVFLGFRGHYQMAKIHQDAVFVKGFGYVALLGLLFPLVVIVMRKFFDRLFRARPQDVYLQMPVEREDERDLAMWWMLLGIFALCLGTTALFYIRAHQIPLLPWFTGGASGTLRQVLGRTNYINPYLKTFFMLQFPAYLSFYSYVKARKTKTWRWIGLFLAYFVLAVIGKTYDFQKAPVIVYFLCFFFLEMYIGKIRLGGILAAAALAIGGIVGMYVFVFGFEGSLLDPYNGPLSRVLFSQVAGFFHTVNIFPSRFGFLRGESLPTILANLFDVGTSWRRSADVVMQLVNPFYVLRRTAGVMNSVFLAEAYANWAAPGVILGIVYVATLFAGVQSWCFGARKSAGNLTLMTVFLWVFSMAFQGGFVDFLYNANLLVFIALMLIMNFVSGLFVRHLNTPAERRVEKQYVEKRRAEKSPPRDAPTTNAASQNTAS